MKFQTGYYLTRINMINYLVGAEDKSQKRVSMACTLKCDDPTVNRMSIPHFTLTFNFNSREDRLNVEKILCKCTTSTGHDYYDFELSKTEHFNKVAGDRIDTNKVKQAVEKNEDVYMWIKRSQKKSTHEEILTPVSVDELPDDVYYEVFPEDKR